MSGFKKFLKRVVFGALILFGVVVLVALSLREYLHATGSRKLREVTGRLDADDPGWRLGALQEARGQTPVPPEQDAAAAVLHIHALGDAPWRAASLQMEWDSHAARTNRTPPFRVLLWLAAARTPTAEARDYGRTRLPQCPAGRFPLALHDNPYSILLPHLEKVRGVYGLMDYDATLAALDGEPSRAMQANRAILHASRAIGDEPCLISQLVRIAGANIASRSAERMLSWNEANHPNADAELAALQAAFAAEAETPWLSYGLRGERAMANHLFEGIASGRITPDHLARMADSPNPHAIHIGAFHLYRGFLPGDHAECLRILTAYLEAAKLPPHEQLAAIRAIAIPAGPPQNYGVVITRLILPACEKVAIASLRVRGELLAASAAIACERFRMANGRWPATLDEIPPALLPVIPIDPFTGTPIRYEHLDDGIAVFSVGPEHLNAAQNRTPSGPFLGQGVGWRLWNPALRGLPPESRTPTEAVMDLDGV